MLLSNLRYLILHGIVLDVSFPLDTIGILWFSIQLHLLLLLLSMWLQVFNVLVGFDLRLFNESTLGMALRCLNRIVLVRFRRSRKWIQIGLSNQRRRVINRRRVTWILLLELLILRMLTMLLLLLVFIWADAISKCPR